MDGVREIRRELLTWYRRHRRDLPWRATPANPYHALVSEAMLQQTQVATVIAYFGRFIDAFPTVHALADADEQHVLRLWQGLGYYRRARNLHAAAKMIVVEFDAQVPRTVDSLMRLPGVGRYTAGAIASIGHDQPAPILDGNVARVLARAYALRESVDQPATLAELWRLAEELVDPESPGDFNQAMMELGALVCTPRTPSCLVCPWRKRCKALELGLVEELPVKTPKKKPVEVEHCVAVVESGGDSGGDSGGGGGKWLFVKRPEKGLWSNLWEFPTWELEAGQTGTAAGLKAWLKECHGVSVSGRGAGGGVREGESFTHQTTHRTIRFRVFWAKAKGLGPAGENRVWRAIHEIDDLPLSNPQRRVAAARP